jgi:hypothetical protein
MLSLIKLDDRIDLVCSDDPDVAPKDGDTSTRWLPVAEADVGADALVATIRPLSSSEMAIIAPEGVGPGNMMVLSTSATRVGVVALRGPGIGMDKRSDIIGLLDRMSVAHRAPLGTAIIMRSVLPADPTDAAE